MSALEYVGIALALVAAMAVFVAVGAELLIRWLAAGDPTTNRDPERDAGILPLVGRRRHRNQDAAKDEQGGSR